MELIFDPTNAVNALVFIVDNINTIGAKTLAPHASSLTLITDMILEARTRHDGAMFDTLLEEAWKKIYPKLASPYMMRRSGGHYSKKLITVFAGRRDWPWMEMVIWMNEFKQIVNERESIRVRTVIDTSDTSDPLEAIGERTRSKCGRKRIGQSSKPPVDVSSRDEGDEEANGSMCPITRAVIEIPLFVRCCKRLFEKSALDEALRHSDACPLCGKKCAVIQVRGIEGV
jgi:hypothetical protein